ncbi:MAG: hypothetical protein F4Z28_16205 [Gammaproteobacteria bacterium]|nr:hypothetical protein [Gammaproteobacteria bacterium]
MCQRCAVHPGGGLLGVGYPAGQFVGEVVVTVPGVGRYPHEGHLVDAAHEVAATLADAGTTIVSGLARGVDTAAHREPSTPADAQPPLSARASMWSSRPRTGSSSSGSSAAAR